MHDAEQFRCEPTAEPAPEDPENEVASVAEDLPADAQAAPPDQRWMAGAQMLGARLDAGLALLGGDGIIRWCNHSFEEHHGGGPRAGRHVLDLHDPNDPVYEDPAALRLETEPDAEYRFEREVAGRVVRYCLRRLLPDEAPAAGTRSDTVEADGTTFVLETAAISASRAGLRPGPFPEAMLDAEGTVLSANRAFAELVGARVGDLLGRSLPELVDPADRARVVTLLSDTLGAARTATDTTTSNTTSSTIEVRLARFDGDPGWAELVAVAGGEPATLVLGARDVTARKRDALLLQEVFEAAPLPYALVDTDGMVVGVNPAWRQRLGPRHGPGRPLTDAVAEESRQQLVDLLSAGSDAAAPSGGAGASSGAVLTTGPTNGGFELVTLLELAEGGPALARLQATALHDLDEQVERLLVSLDDLTAHALEVEAARRVSGQIRATLDEVDLAVVSHAVDGKAQELNLGAVRLFGHSAPALIGAGPLPPGWQARRRDGTLLADGDHPLSQVLATGGPISAAEVLWLSPSTAAEAAMDEADQPARSRYVVVRARAVTQLRPARRLGAVVAYAEIGGELPDSFLSGEQSGEATPHPDPAEPPDATAR